MTPYSPYDPSLFEMPQFGQVSQVDPGTPQGAAGMMASRSAQGAPPQPQGRPVTPPRSYTGGPIEWKDIPKQQRRSSMFSSIGQSLAAMRPQTPGDFLQALGLGLMAGRDQAASDYARLQERQYELQIADEQLQRQREQIALEFQSMKLANEGRGLDNEIKGVQLEEAKGQSGRRAAVRGVVDSRYGVDEGEEIPAAVAEWGASVGAPPGIIDGITMAYLSDDYERAQALGDEFLSSVAAQERQGAIAQSIGVPQAAGLPQKEFYSLVGNVLEESAKKRLGLTGGKDKKDDAVPEADARVLAKMATADQPELEDEFTRFYMRDPVAYRNDLTEMRKGDENAFREIREAAQRTVVGQLADELGAGAPAPIRDEQGNVIGYDKDNLVHLDEPEGAAGAAGVVSRTFGAIDEVLPRPKPFSRFVGKDGSVEIKLPEKGGAGAYAASVAGTPPPDVNTPVTPKGDGLGTVEGGSPEQVIETVMTHKARELVEADPVVAQNPQFAQNVVTRMPALIQQIRTTNPGLSDEQIAELVERELRAGIANARKSMEQQAARDAAMSRIQGMGSQPQGAWGG